MQQVAVERFIDTYLEPVDDDGPYKAGQKPGPFLGEDGRCTIHDVRSTVCREYPRTDKKGFTFRTMGARDQCAGLPRSVLDCRTNEAGGIGIKEFMDVTVTG